MSSAVNCNSALVVKRTFWHVVDVDGFDEDTTFEKTRLRAMSDSILLTSQDELQDDYMKANCHDDDETDAGSSSEGSHSEESSDSNSEGSPKHSDFDGVSPCQSRHGQFGDLPSGAEANTTIVLRKLPSDFSRSTLTSMLDAHGFNKVYNFVYMPTNFKKSVPLGYAIVNFESHEIAKLACLHFTSRQIQVEWGDSIQGLEALVQKYRNSAVMHPSVSDAHRPILLKKGQIIPFPPPTEVLSVPPCGVQRASAKKSTSSKVVETQLVPSFSCSVSKQTTVVLRKIPKDTTRDLVQRILKEQGFAGTYDFLYLPMDFEKAQCFGFAIVNFIDGSIAASALDFFSRTTVFGQKVCAEWKETHHGLAALVEKYRNSKVMHADVPEVYKPLILSNGRPVPFPAPHPRC